MHTQPVTTLRGQVITQLDGKPICVSYHIQCEHGGATKSVDLSCRIDGLKKNISLYRTIEDSWFFTEKN
jgi:hypothetical protein